jgi:hypothetical protein
VHERISRRGPVGRFRGLLAFAFACVAAGAFAQQAPSAPAPSATAITAARALVAATGISRSFANLVPQLMDQIGKHLTQTRPELNTDLAAVLVALKPEFDRQVDEMIEIAARVYAKHIPEPDLQAAVAFFASPPGRAYVEAQPTILTEVVTAMQGWQGKISTDMMAKVRAEMKKKGHEL